MMKLLPQQLELWYIIPAIRRAFALEMVRQGMKGVEIASLLGVTKAAVSQYFSKTRAVEFRFDQEIREEIKASVARIIKGEEVAAELQRIILLLRESKSICKFHHFKEDIDPHCDICFRH